MTVGPETSAQRENTQVVIVGAGPVGLALALELGTRGIGCIVVERRDGSLTVPRMSQVSTRSMEFCRRWGVAEEVKSAVWSANHAMDFVYLTSLCGDEISRLEVPSYGARGELPFSPEGPCHCPQIYFDPILAARAATLPSVAIRYDTLLNGFEQVDGGVTAEVVDLPTGEIRSLRGAFLVGCDGPGGVVRDALGIALDGRGVVAHSINIFFRSAELASVHDKGWAKFYRLIDDTGCWAELIAIDGIDLWRLTVFHAASGGPSADDCLLKAVGKHFPHEIIDISPWERRDYVARTFSLGRVFIAGDAAHQCSPTGGLGMHTGIGEAGNLGWKLAAAVDGWAGPGLLASYDAECRPIAARNVGFATQAFDRITGLPGAGAARKVLADNETRLDMLTVNEQSKTQYCYEDSPICVADGAAPPPEGARAFIPSARPGTRAPHGWIAPQRSTLDLFGDGFVLLSLSGGEDGLDGMRRAAAARGVPLTCVALDDPEIAALYERRLVLVRPDGHVAWRGDTPPSDPGALIAHVRGGGREPGPKRRGASRG